MPLPEQFAAVAKKLNNWGRWGEEDERGTLNFIQKSAVTRGYDSVRSWEPISVFWQKEHHETPWHPLRVNCPSSLVLSDVGVPVGEPSSPSKVSTDRLNVATGDTSYFLSLAATSHAGRMYNGFDGSTVTPFGATRLSAGSIGPLITRALLLDPARAAGVDALAPGQKLTRDDLDAAVALAGAKPQPGDVLLIRTGGPAYPASPSFDAGLRTREDGSWAGSPGLSLDAAEWLHASEAAAVCVDTPSVDALPLDSPPLHIPVRLILSVDVGMTIGLMFDLERLGEVCAERSQYCGLFVCTPLALDHSVTAPAMASVVL